MANLTAKQSKFVDSYLVTGLKNDAAIYAGYPAKDAVVISCQLLKNPKIITKITEIKAKLAENKLSIELKDAKAFSKDEFVGYALNDYKALDITEPNKPRFLQLAGHASGILGTNDGRSSNTTNNIQVNISGAETTAQLWELTRKIISGENINIAGSLDV